MIKRFGIIAVLGLIFVFSYNSVLAASLSPYGKFEWSDNIVDVFRKLKEIKTIKEISINGPESFDRVNAVEKSEEDLKAGITDFVKKGARGWRFSEFNKEIILKDGKKSLYHIRAINLKAQPIILAGIPYRISFKFVQVPGYVLTDYDKAIKIDINGKEILFLSQFTIIKLTPLDNELAEAFHQKLFDVIRKKYPVLKDVFGHEWNGKPNSMASYYSEDGDYSFGFSPGKQEPEMEYTNSFQSVEEMYNKHKNNILSEENKKSDSSSEL